MLDLGRVLTPGAAGLGGAVRSRILDVLFADERQWTPAEVPMYLLSGPEATSLTKICLGPSCSSSAPPGFPPEDQQLPAGNALETRSTFPFAALNWSCLPSAKSAQGVQSIHHHARLVLSEKERPRLPDCKSKNERGSNRTQSAAMETAVACHRSCLRCWKDQLQAHQ